ncbi:hypothetical protein V5O48_005798 [Marasmius crinis-equi]|uniref:Uncharacterized protein n=1 Tax=Marasmius crinis-equi TaxID=585013 RepID=A0ABR3FL97_9AGAR
MTDCLKREHLGDIEEMRALYDTLGGPKWLATPNPGEHPSLVTLEAVFWRLLDNPTDKELNSTGWDMDSDLQASWIYEESDSDEEARPFSQVETDEEGEEEEDDEKENGQSEGEESDEDVPEVDELNGGDNDWKDTELELDVDPLGTALVETASVQSKAEED